MLQGDGGSLEDLWPFNEEIVARAIFESEIPIISAVGHETDFTISDFVSDLRAPTPSAAAELAVPNIYDINLKLNDINNRLKTALNRKVQIMRLRYEKSMNSRVFKEPLQPINEKYMILDMKIKQLEVSISKKHINENSRFVNIVNKLDTLSPLKTLARGYSIVTIDGKNIKSEKQVKENDIINIKLSE